jgi:hypothetical protein
MPSLPRAILGAAPMAVKRNAGGFLPEFGRNRSASGVQDCRIGDRS